MSDTAPIVITGGSEPCPRCGGRGSVSAGVDPYTGSSTILTCDMCFGAKTKSVTLHPARPTCDAK